MDYHRVQQRKLTVYFLFGRIATRLGSYADFQSAGWDVHVNADGDDQHQHVRSDDPIHDGREYPE
jgi:hypothetical protein